MSGTHTEHHYTSSAFVTDVVIGMSDGLTVPFALAAGLSGAVHNTTLVITAGLAEIAAGSIAMGLGGYMAGKTAVDYYNAELKREYYEVDHVPEQEKKEIREIFEDMGVTGQVQTHIVEEMAKDRERWVEFMMRYELGLEKPDPKRARKSAFNIGGSYIVGGLVPLSPYFFTHDDPQLGLLWSCAITVCCLLVFGYLRARFTGQNVWIGAVRVTLTGSVAAGAAFFIARLFNSK
jgi:vacuolar iron transporter family protein